MEKIFNKTVKNSKCAVIVAHPDDETLWAGGTILMNPDNDWTIVTICRKNDPDRAPKFFSVLEQLNAHGSLGNLDDGPDQTPLQTEQVQGMILSLLPERTYDLILTHSTQGEYTRHRRHEEVAEAVIRLIETQQLKTEKIRMFAYEDGGRNFLPKPIESADQFVHLSRTIWDMKYRLITKIYGFDEESWEARTTPHTEAFWSFRTVAGIRESIKDRSTIQ